MVLSTLVYSARDIKMNVHWSRTATALQASIFFSSLRPRGSERAHRHSRSTRGSSHSTNTTEYQPRLALRCRLVWLLPTRARSLTSNMGRSTTPSRLLRRLLRRSTVLSRGRRAAAAAFTDGSSIRYHNRSRTCPRLEGDAFRGGLLPPFCAAWGSWRGAACGGLGTRRPIVARL